MSRGRSKEPANPDRIVDPGFLPHAIPKWRGNLPHLFKDGCTYFVTFCLFDAADRRKSKQPSATMENEATCLASESDPPPDRGSCLLSNPFFGAIVEQSLLHSQGDRFALSGWCVMPNHVHVIVTPYSGHTLSTILHSWKSFTAHEINKELGRTGGLWEEEFFDHIVRDEKSMERFVKYIEDNPVAAGLCERPELWPFSSARFRDQSA